MHLSDLVFVDIEASGLHGGSYPIEIGWADIDLNAGSFLLSPHDTWTKLDWDPMSEKVHGIALEDCMKNGIPVPRAISIMNEVLKGKRPVSDAPSFDGFWLRRLADAGPFEMPCPFVDLRQVLASVYAVHPINDKTWEKIHGEVSDILPHTHRAAADALHMAALVRGIFDMDFVRRRVAQGGLTAPAVKTET